MGDGVSIDPVRNVLVAPCDGQVIHIHPSNHAATLAIANGLELLHIGVDTVNLTGEGFTLRVKGGSSECR